MENHFQLSLLSAFAKKILFYKKFFYGYFTKKESSLYQTKSCKQVYAKNSDYKTALLFSSTKVIKKSDIGERALPLFLQFMTFYDTIRYFETLQVLGNQW